MLKKKRKSVLLFQLYRKYLLCEGIKENQSYSEPKNKEQETASLVRIPDSFRKIVIVKDYLKPYKDENGIQYIGIEQFLLDETII